jgi:hypothetical protein
MASGGTGQEVGRRYRVGLHMILCHGVATVKKMFLGDRKYYTDGAESVARAYTGWLPSSAIETSQLQLGRLGAVIYEFTVSDLNSIEAGEPPDTLGDDEEGYLINLPNLFGGDEQEGGFQGVVRVYSGAEGQGRSRYLARVQSLDFRPNYEGLCGVIWENCHYGSINPYIKNPSFEVERAPFDYIGVVPGYTTLGTMIGNDANPASIIAEVFRERKWSIGLPEINLNLDSFARSREILFNENFGLSLKWSGKESIEDFAQVVMNHVNGSIYHEPLSNELFMYLIREVPDEDISNLVVLDESNSTLDEFTRSVWGETVNEITVVFKDTELDQDDSITIQNIANIYNQNNQIISETINYTGIRNRELASRVCKRDLKTKSTPLAKGSISADRVARNLRPGHPFLISNVTRGLSNLLCRVVDIDLGNNKSREIKILWVEDSFAEQASSYINAADIITVENPSDTTIDPVTDYYIHDMPYFQWFSLNPGANELPIGVCLTAIALKQPKALSSRAEIRYSPTDTTYSVGPFSSYSGTALINGNLTKTTANIPFTSDNNLFTIVDENGAGGDSILGRLLITNTEIFEVTGLDVVNQTLQVNRGVLDTPPTEHAIGERMWLMSDSVTDGVERAFGDIDYFKFLPHYPNGSLAESAAIARSYTMADRYHRPYCPGNIKINSVLHPANITGDIAVTWSHRDRLAQTGGIITFTEGNIGPEIGTTYNVRVYDSIALTLIKTQTGIAGTSFTYLQADELLETGSIHANLRIEVEAVLGGLVSFRPYNHSFIRI